MKPQTSSPSASAPRHDDSRDHLSNAPNKSNASNLDAFFDSAHLLVLDPSGRPLGEGPTGLVPTSDYAACPYSDARASVDLQMNVGALRQVNAQWQTMMAMWQRELGRVGGANPTLAQAWVASELLRCDAVVAACEGRLTEPVAAAHKTMLGMSKSLLILGLSNPDSAGMALRELISADEFFEYLDFTKMLIGANEVCAGSPARIRALFGAEPIADSATDAPERVTPSASQSLARTLRVHHWLIATLLDALVLAAVREQILAGRVDVPAFFDRPDRQDRASWPTSARWHAEHHTFAAQAIRLALDVSASDVRAFWQATGYAMPDRLSSADLSSAAAYTLSDLDEIIEEVASQTANLSS